ncbi:hypothetical protein DAMA08_002790 [Martiniozyma asiatica (nom. inval.)]|nr:hypothetical protein DAMA08_002790 [Martiniozyma asiatica]
MSDFAIQGLPGGFNTSIGGGPVLLPNSSPWKNMQTTPEKKSNRDTTVKSSPSANTFSFTPSRGGRLYPLIDPPVISTELNSSPVMNDSIMEESYIQRENQSFVSAMDTLQEKMFSSNISNKVLNEFQGRYNEVRDENIVNLENFNNSTTNEELNRRASGRYSKDHKSRFSKMESISLHYAAKRADQKSKIKSNLTPRRTLISGGIVNGEIGQSEIGDKRLQNKLLESASKRLKMLSGRYKEINSSPTKQINSSPTKPLEQKKELKKHYQNADTLKDISLNARNVLPPCENDASSTPLVVKEFKEKRLPSYLMPTKASLQKSASNKQISPSKSIPNLKAAQVKQIVHSKSIPNLNRQQDKQIKSNLKLSPSKLSLSSILNSKIPQAPSSSSIFKSPSKISPSKASSNLNAHIKQEAQVNFDIAKSHTYSDINLKSSKIPISLSSKSVGISSRLHSSSSIPRLALGDSRKSQVWKY